MIFVRQRTCAIGKTLPAPDLARAGFLFSGICGSRDAIHRHGRRHPHHCDGAQSTFGRKRLAASMIEIGDVAFGGFTG